MGFDMQMRRTPDLCPPDYAPQYKDDLGYFRIVQQGMPVMCVFMDVAETLDEAEAPPLPPWPPDGVESAERAGTVAARGNRADPPPTEAELAAVRSWEAIADEVRSLRSVRADRVPAFKFGSNMDWIVTAYEAGILAQGLRRTLRERPQDFLDALSELEGVELSGDEALAWIGAWARFNEIAAEHGGYRVQ